MKIQTNRQLQGFNKQYSVAINTALLPEKQEERIQLVVDQITPVINQIVTDAMTDDDYGESAELI